MYVGSYCQNMKNAISNFLNCLFNYKHRFRKRITPSGFRPTQKTEPRKVPSVFAFLLSLFRPASRPKAVSSGLQAVHIFQDIFADFVARHAERDRQFAEQPVLCKAEEFFIVGRGLLAHREARLSSGLNGL